jgi:hypothetical protein
MLSKEIMGVLALAILWVNTLLIAGDALKRAGALLALRARLADAVRGRVTRGDGPGGAIATLSIEQIGRAAEDAESIVFHDRGATGKVHGGVITLESGAELALAAQEDVDVWAAAETIARAAACASPEAFDRAYESARKAKGFARTVAAPIGVGDEVFATRDGRFVSTIEPRAALSKRALVALGFVIAEIGLAAGCTLVALWPPVFGMVSTIGGALCLGFFLLVQPAGTALRDAILVPGRALVRGRWTAGHDGAASGPKPRAAFGGANARAA